MNQKIKKVVRSLLLELLVYTVLVSGYFFLVLHFLGNWLAQLFTQNRKTYAVMALLLVVAQGLVLEKLTRVLINFFHGGKEEDGP